MEPKDSQRQVDVHSETRPSHTAKKGPGAAPDELAKNIGRGPGLVPRPVNRDEIDQPGESSGNAASNRTTQKLDEASENAEGSTPNRAAADDLYELSRLGYTVHPKSRDGKPTQPGVPTADIAHLQNAWCRYSGMPSERGNVWHAGRCRVLPGMAKEASYSKASIFSAQPPPGTTHIPANPFSAHTSPMDQPVPVMPVRIGNGENGSNESETLSRRLHQPRNSSRAVHSDGEESNQTPEQKRSSGLPRQLSLPDVSELHDLWQDLPQGSFDLDGLLGANNSLLPWNSTQGSIGQKLMQNSSLLKLDKDNLPMFSSLLQDMRSQRRSRSIRLSSAYSWAPDAIVPSQQPVEDPLKQEPVSQPPDQGASIKDEPAKQQSPLLIETAPLKSLPGIDDSSNLPDQVEMTILTAPAMFGAPTSIGKPFKPPFTVRVGISSTRSVSMEAVVKVYSVQKEQLVKIEQWAPTSHAFNESLSGAACTKTITCQAPEPNVGPASAFADFTFSDLKFLNSSRMKPRWLVFTIALPTDDILYVQYTVPTVVMSRQCDQTPRAMAILHGEQPTRKRPRQFEKAVDYQPPSASSVGWSYNTMDPSQLQNLLQPQASFIPRPAFAHNEDDMQGLGPSWPMDGPYDMAKWREAIQRVCRSFGLTRSFEQEDMHELAKVAGFVGNPATGKRGMSILLPTQWVQFGSWLLSYLHLLRNCRDLWMNPGLKLICGFAMTRERAEQLLFRQGEGTFVIRPSLTLPGTFVISLNHQGEVKHLAIDQQQLQYKSLVGWVCSLDDVQFLLDVDRGCRYPKTQVFGCGPSRASQIGAAPVQPLPAPINYPQTLYPPRGQDALAQILSQSRMGGDSGLYADYPPAGRSYWPGYPMMPSPYPAPYMDQGAPLGIRDNFSEPWTRRRLNDKSALPHPHHDVTK